KSTLKIWKSNYQAMKVLEAQLNACLAGFWVPFILSAHTCISVFAITIILRIHPGPTLSTVAGIHSVGALAYIFILSYMASNCACFSKLDIERQRRRQHHVIVQRRQLKALKPF